MCNNCWTRTPTSAADAKQQDLEDGHERQDPQSTCNVVVCDERLRSILGGEQYVPQSAITREQLLNFVHRSACQIVDNIFEVKVVTLGGEVYSVRMDSRVNKHVHFLKKQIEYLHGTSFHYQEMHLLDKGSDKAFASEADKQAARLKDLDIIPGACTVLMSVKLPTHAMWDTTLRSVESKVVQLAGDDNQIATNQNDEYDESLITTAGAVMLPNSGKHALSVKIGESTQASSLSALGVLRTTVVLDDASTFNDFMWVRTNGKQQLCEFYKVHEPSWSQPLIDAAVDSLLNCTQTSVCVKCYSKAVATLKQKYGTASYCHGSKCTCPDQAHTPGNWFRSSERNRCLVRGWGIGTIFDPVGGKFDDVKPGQVITMELDTDSDDGVGGSLSFWVDGRPRHNAGYKTAVTGPLIWAAVLWAPKASLEIVPDSRLEAGCKDLSRMTEDQLKQHDQNSEQEKAKEKKMYKVLSYLGIFVALVAYIFLMTYRSNQNGELYSCTEPVNSTAFAASCVKR